MNSRRFVVRTDDNTLNLPADPIDGLLLWLKEAEAAKMPEPTAMTLATATRDGVPNARIVLFKGVSQNKSGRRGVKFFTNYESTKSRELEANPNAALVFHWTTMEKQIRVMGSVEKISGEESNAYFVGRARGSQIGAWASPQSQKIAAREVLEKLVHDFEVKFTNTEIVRPENWGGWRLIPNRIEFWHGGLYRLHDRFVFEWSGGAWSSSRLAP
jgi:pyridoxamine 5'-phosphate oxidase